MAKSTLSPFVQKARAAQASGRFGDAEQFLVQGLKKQPRDKQTLIHLARLYNRKLKRPEKATALISTLLRVAPKMAITHELAAETYTLLRHLDRAETHADQAAALGGENPDTLYVAATVYQQVGRYGDATALMTKALLLRPDHLPSKLLLATALRSAGDLKEAEDICRQIFADYPDSIQNLTVWSQTCKQTGTDPIYVYIRDTLAPQLRTTNSPHLPRLLQILGKAENDIGNYEHAFTHFAQSKQSEQIRHNPDINKRFVTTLIANTSRADYFGVAGNPSENPVLVVGMPRTGSTLLEQILSSHPDIGGIGEASILRDLAKANGFQQFDAASLIKAVKDMTPAKAKEVGDTYLAYSEARQPGMARVVNKNLHNFELLNFFAKIFPKARIISALRDPMDNCVSCYLAPLSAFHSYTQDLKSLGQYYSEFRRLMDHWKTAIPNPMIDVNYEDIVADTEGKAREIIDFLGLDWDPACLAFQENENRARTISTWQVRQPIYKSSVKRWTRYETHLDPLKQELAHLYPDGF